MLSCDFHWKTFCRYRFDSSSGAGSELPSDETILKSNETVDLNELIKEKVTSTNEYCFIYLTYAIPRSSEHFTPYSLKKAKYNEIDHNEFFTVDREGVTYFSRHENHFTKLHIWQTEYDLYLKIMKVWIFVHSRKWYVTSKEFKKKTSCEHFANIDYGKGLKFGKRQFIGENTWKRDNFSKIDCFLQILGWPGLSYLYVKSIAISKGFASSTIQLSKILKCSTLLKHKWLHLSLAKIL